MSCIGVVFNCVPLCCIGGCCIYVVLHYVTLCYCVALLDYCIGVLLLCARDALCWILLNWCGVPRCCLASLFYWCGVALCCIVSHWCGIALCWCFTVLH